MIRKQMAGLITFSMIGFAAFQSGCSNPDMKGILSTDTPSSEEKFSTRTPKATATYNATKTPKNNVNSEDNANNQNKNDQNSDTLQKVKRPTKPTKPTKPTMQAKPSEN